MKISRNALLHIANCVFTVSIIFCGTLSYQVLAQESKVVTFGQKQAQVEKFRDTAVFSNIATFPKEELQAKLIEAGTGSGRFKYFHGADFGDFAKALMEDVGFAFKDFTKCQRKEFKHVLPLFLLNGLISGGGGGKSMSVSDAMGELGKVTGAMTDAMSSAMDAIPFLNAKFTPYTPIWWTSGICFKWWIIWPYQIKMKVASLVPYQYPVDTTDVSENMFQTPYHLKPLVESVLMKIILKMEDATAVKQLGLYSKELAMSGIVPNGFKDDDVKKAYEAVKAARGKTPDLALTTTNLNSQYARIIFHPMNVIAEVLPGIAHQPRFPYYGTDFPTALQYSRIRLLSYNLTLAKAPIFFTPFGSRICVLQNVSTGKTPIELLLPEALLMAVQNAAKGQVQKMCIKDVGEKIPIDNRRRPEISDGAFQGLERALEITTATGGGNRSTDGLNSAVAKGLNTSNYGELTKQVGGLLDTGLKGAMSGAIKDSGLLSSEGFQNVNVGGLDRYIGNLNFTKAFGQKLGSIFGQGSYHTFRRDLDYFKVVRGEAFREESTVCGLIDDVTIENMKFQKGNVKKIGEGGLSAFAGYRYFHTCWGFRDKSEGWWRSGYPGSNVYKFISTAPNGGQDKILRKY